MRNHFTSQFTIVQLSIGNNHCSLSILIQRLVSALAHKSNQRWNPTARITLIFDVCGTLNSNLPKSNPFKVQSTWSEYFAQPTIPTPQTWCCFLLSQDCSICGYVQASSVYSLWLYVQQRYGTMIGSVEQDVAAFGWWKCWLGNLLNILYVITPYIETMLSCLFGSDVARFVVGLKMIWRPAKLTHLVGS